MIYRHWFKRILDILISLVALPFVFLEIIILGPIIYFTDRGPIFYNAERLGRNGKIFKMYKFRSMKINAEDIRNEDGTTYNAEDDPRVTKIGRFMRKTSLDEFPQFLNVLKGDMSIIGPRPDLPDAMTELYTEETMKKLVVRPGITGYCQAYFRNDLDLEKRFEKDVYYAEHVSFLMDVKIFFATIVTVIGRKGVYRNREEEKTHV